ncbi:MAG: ATP-dependent sacrificial sulfur transferase LarE [Candidatus Omnitrophica bacterium]|nr:ATP-dependent sacrificial sulfur transferase LarE [Candidatus Omnitrophota bacterium]
MTCDKESAVKYEVLKKILSGMGSLLVAYSGGVDSTFLLKVAENVLDKNVVAVTARSETYPAREFKEAEKLLKHFNVKHIVIDTKELENEKFTANTPQRCYYCKSELFSKLIQLAKELGLKYVADGSNYDDLSDYRPGMKAACELGIRSPLQEAKLTKEDIRALSNELKLPTWKKPSFACLSSRFPYGVKITQEELTKIDKAEEYILSFGIEQVRVRAHGPIARIEIPAENIPGIFDNGISKKITDKLKSLGYTYVSLDLEGYRTGSMNAVLDNKE